MHHTNSADDKRIFTHEVKTKPHNILPLRIVGGIYAVQSERPVHHGGSGLEFPLHDGRTGLRDPGSDQQTDDPATQPDPSPMHLVRLHPPLLLHVQGFHENEITVSISHYRPQTKLREGNVFTLVCQSFCSQDAMGQLQATPPGRHPLWADSPPRANTPLGADSPPPRADTLHPGQTPPIWVIYCVCILAQIRSGQMRAVCILLECCSCLQY